MSFQPPNHGAQPQPAAGGNFSQISSKYKTVLCKHFHEDPNSCAKGNACQFAHGHDELRKHSERIPDEVQLKLMRVPYNNYKTQVCRFFQEQGYCQYDRNCTYAHGDAELRRPYE